MSNYAVIMAGGVGTRFWPKGTVKHPKQFLKIGDGNYSMIQQTFKRLEGLVADDKVFVVTNVNYKNEVHKQLPKIPEENIICEPFGRNTAPCIGLAALFIKQFDPEGNIIVLPADHIIKDVSEFQKILKCALKFSKDNGGIVTLGIKPTEPSTGYGYIQFDPDKKIDISLNGDECIDKEVYKVKTFAEKPDLQLAKMFLESGDFLWNSGMFIFRTDIILNEMKSSLPDMFESILSLEKHLFSKDFNKELEDVYGQIKGISIDYGIMEKAENVYTIKSEFGWNDVGSWDEIYNINQKDENGNVMFGKAQALESKNSLVMSDAGFTALIGVEDLLVINTENGLLICKKSESQKVKEVVEYLKRKGLDNYL